MNRRRPNPPFLNGIPELLVLHQLTRGPMHGYELVQAIRTNSGHAFEFGEGCIYPILHRLEADGMLLSKRETVAGRGRFVYHLTDKGRNQFVETEARWKQVVRTVQFALGAGADDGHPALA